MNAEEELGQELTPEERARRRRRMAAILAVVVALLLAVFVPPLVSLGRYRRSITASIANALGRPVAAGGISLRLLPRPGIALSDFTVEEDPAFGAEPALHANSVVVSLRLSSLWRRKLEISRISLDQASLNLVRNAGGQWSIDTVLLRASQIPNAPTAQRHAGPTPRFPYIEATNSRIDFKNGAEKKPFSLMNAEFAMWQASGGQWRLRLKAQPVRTDLPLQLSDVGELNVAGSLQRSTSLAALPLDLTVAWRGAQLGQVSELLRGDDSGWRSSLDLTGRIRGTPADLKLLSTVHIGNLRRQEFQPLTTLDVQATCNAEYLHQQRALNNITCFVPVAPGHLLLTGSVNGAAPAGANLRLEINHVPAEFPVMLLGLMRASLQNATATGDINGSFSLTSGKEAGENRAESVLSGDATATGVSITNDGGNWALPTLHFVAGGAGEKAGSHGAQSRVLAQRGTREGNAAVAQLGHGVALEPVAIPFGENAPLTVEGTVTRSGFSVHLAGAASMQRLTAPGATLGLLTHALAGAGRMGKADLNVTTSGGWIPPLGGPGVGVITSGAVQLTGAQIQPGFLPAPVQVQSAEIVIGPQQIAWHDAAIRYEGISLRGAVTYPTDCQQATPCAAVFDVQAPALSGSDLSAALEGQRRGFFGQMIANALGGARRSPWPAMQGTIQAKTFTLDRLALRDVTAVVSIDSSGLTLKSFDGAALGGMVHATGGMTLANGTPNWHVDVQCTGVRPAEAAGMFHEHWGTGLFNGEAKLTLSGRSTGELETSAAGAVQFTWQKGGLAAGTGTGPLGRFGVWTSSGTLANGALTLTGGGVTVAGRITPVRGSVGFDRHVDLTVQTRSGTVHLRGTLAHPVAAH